MRHAQALKTLLLAVTVPLAACGSTIGSTTAPSDPLSSTLAESASRMTEATFGGPAAEMTRSPASMTATPQAPEMTESTVITVDATTTQPTGKSEPAAPPALIITSATEFGQILFDGSGQAIYLFDRETASAPDCYGECADAWPPVLTTGTPEPGSGVRAELLGTTPRTDGSTQVTYAGHPLYFYAAEGTNMVTCHNVREFDGLWLTVTASGEPADV